MVLDCLLLVTKIEKKFHIQAVLVPQIDLLAIKVLKGMVLWQTTTFVLQIQMLGQTGVILCKTHPDILFCLFGLVRMGLCGGQTQLGSHSSGDTYGLKSSTTNLCVEEVLWVCSTRAEFIIRSSMFIVKTSSNYFKNTLTMHYIAPISITSITLRQQIILSYPQICIPRFIWTVCNLYQISMVSFHAALHTYCADFLQFLYLENSYSGKCHSYCLISDVLFSLT